MPEQPPLTTTDRRRIAGDAARRIDSPVARALADLVDAIGPDDVPVIAALVPLVQACQAQDDALRAIAGWTNPATALEANGLVNREHVTWMQATAKRALGGA